MPRQFTIIPKSKRTQVKIVLMAIKVTLKEEIFHNNDEVTLLGPGLARTLKLRPSTKYVVMLNKKTRRQLSIGIFSA